MDNRISFEDIYEQNKRRIHYQIHKMNIHDPHQEFFQEGLIAMWRAYETYQPDKGPMATYFNYTIRNRLIDRINKENHQRDIQRKAIQEDRTQLTDGNHQRQNGMATPLPHEAHIPIDNPNLWNQIKSRLTDNQWKWLYHHVLEGMSYPEIAQAENTTVEAVKSRGKQVKKKLRDSGFQKGINLDELL
ncbi:sigma-70 family RNA polymerase sigma factor [Lentibacillus jeotgali]|uniref:sigma-70 family RNA polymerase sigma factor n=1 Tax=Lentibacillus jeotgali TaxID=558169 RepID=UPI0002627040|nr:sigma-70 family RNA polymerase sigma factor [Lentibacillus jeotgali]